MLPTAPALYVAFASDRRIAAGPLEDVLPVLKRRFDQDASDLPLVFDVAQGKAVDFDLRGTLEDVLAREAAPPQRGPGRPRLGVTSREISLLPRHWEWLEHQENGASAALRRVVEHAMKSQPGKDRGRRARAALSRILTALAGNRGHFEEAMRALFAGDDERFARLVARWPSDVRELALQQMAEAARAEREDVERSDGGHAEANVSAVRDLYRSVWSFGDYAAIERLVAQSYVIHSDPGDAWEGKTLDRKEYATRVRASRVAFPDLTFTIDDLVASGSRVAVRWHANGTHDGDLRSLPATGRRVTFSGQTFYAVERAHVTGHWQVVDRLGFAEQVR